MNQKEIESLKAEGYTHVPLKREYVADLATPLSVYLTLANHPYSYLFESVQGGEKWGRYSIIGLPAECLIKINGTSIRLEKVGKNVETIEVTDPLTWLHDFQKKIRVAPLPDLPHFFGGFVGYFGYEAVQWIEPRLQKFMPPDSLLLPDAVLMVSDTVIVFDNLRCTLAAITLVDLNQEKSLEEAEKKLDKIEKDLCHSLQPVLPLRPMSHAVEGSFASQQSYPEFEKAILKIKEYILAGDVMQVVYSRRLSAPFSENPLNFYRVLRSLNPSPYLYFLNLNDFYIAGSSPEILVRCENDEITLRPLAGTRPRGKTETEDQQLEKELLLDEKEIAEHIMLMDLGRNDVGRVAEPGTVTVTEKMKVERYSHVMHIVSNVTGKLKKGLNMFDVLRATFPAGTLSGAPKIRAMEIIGELEPVKRGVYGGAIGYLGWQGNLDMAIAIRTAIIKDKKIYVQAGAGIVADSIPQNEWQETENKAMALLKAAANLC